MENQYQVDVRDFSSMFYHLKTLNCFPINQIDEYNFILSDDKTKRDDSLPLKVMTYQDSFAFYTEEINICLNDRRRLLEFIYCAYPPLYCFIVENNIKQIPLNLIFTFSTTQKKGFTNCKFIYNTYYDYLLLIALYKQFHDDNRNIFHIFRSDYEKYSNLPQLYEMFDKKHNIGINSFKSQFKQVFSLYNLSFNLNVILNIPNPSIYFSCPIAKTVVYYKTIGGI